MILVFLDGLAVIRSKSPRSAETITKTSRNIFYKSGFKIKVESVYYVLVQTDFLDIELDLNTETYLPFENQILIYSL